MSADPYRGSCLCGAVRIEASPPSKIFSVVCHCTICQRLGSAAGQALGGGHLDSYDTSAGMTRHRCRTCGSSVYNQSKLPEFDFRDCPLAIFERDDDGIIMRLDELRPRTHIFCAHKTPRLEEEDVARFAGHARQSEKVDG